VKRVRSVCQLVGATKERDLIWGGGVTGEGRNPEVREKSVEQPIEKMGQRMYAENDET